MRFQLASGFPSLFDSSALQWRKSSSAAKSTRGAKHVLLGPELVYSSLSRINGLLHKVRTGENFAFAQSFASVNLFQP